MIILHSFLDVTIPLVLFSNFFVGGAEGDVFDVFHFLDDAVAAA